MGKIKVYLPAFSLLVFIVSSVAQNHQLVTVTEVISGNDTNNVLFKAQSTQIPSLSYIRAQKVKGPQNGIFTIHEDNIRYVSLSKIKGIPNNLSKIRFTFLQSDAISVIPPSNFRFIINDIDGPNNEALSTYCNECLEAIGTSVETNLILNINPPTIDAVGSLEENEGPTSRVMFDFINVTYVEFENYANEGYLKDFDLNDDYPIAQPIYTKCKKVEQIVFKEDTIISWSKEVLNKSRGVLKVNTNPIYFNRDKFDIRNDAVLELTKIQSLLKMYPKLKIEIGSHTDSRENDDYNLELSEKRTNSVLSWLFNKGVSPNQLSGKGYGETKLVNNCSNGVNCSEEAHQLNRRTEFVVLNPEVIK